MILSETMKKMVVKKITVGQERYVVLVDIGGRKDIPDFEYNWNMYCIDNNDKIIWQASGIPSKHSRDSFVAIYLDGDILKADRFFGGEYAVSIPDGKVEEVGWHK